MTESNSYPQLVDGELTLRPFRLRDKKAWKRIRAENREWLRPWEATVPDISLRVTGMVTFSKLIRLQKKEAYSQKAFAFGMFVGPNFVGQITLGGVIFGALRGAHIGYWIDRNYANRGLTTKAVNMVTDFAFKELELHRIEINIRPENPASIRVAEKCGYLYEGKRLNYLHIDGQWRDHLCYVKENARIK